MPERTLTASTVATLLGGRSTRGPAYSSLADALRQLILDGRLPLSARLPGERELAAMLGLSRTTITAAYTLLRDQGFVLTQRGSRGITSLPRGTTPVNVPHLELPRPDAPLDLSLATLPAPEGVMHQAYASALTCLTTYLPTHGYTPLGLPALRAILAERYTRRGLPTDAEQIIVTFGAQHALTLLVRVITAPGDRVLVDHPTYLHALDTFRDAGCRLVPVALTEEGWDVEALLAALRQTSPRLAYLIPDFHNPTGHCMPSSMRSIVAHAAQKARTTVVVDETMADLAIDVPVPVPFAAADLQAEIVSLGSFSKSFWGGLRLGWIRAPRELATRLAAARAASDLGAPLVEQLAAVQLLADAEPILDDRRALIRSQRDVLMEQLTEHLPAWRYHIPEGGLSLWATLPAPLSSALAASAPRFGVRVSAGPLFGTEGLFERQIRVPFTLPSTDLSEAVKRLARAFHALSAGGFAEASRMSPEANVV